MNKQVSSHSRHPASDLSRTTATRFAPRTLLALAAIVLFTIVLSTIVLAVPAAALAQAPSQPQPPTQAASAVPAPTTAANPFAAPAPPAAVPTTSVFGNAPVAAPAPAQPLSPAGAEDQTPSFSAQAPYLGTGTIPGYNNPAATVLNQSLATQSGAATAAPPGQSAQQLPPLPTPANVFPSVVEDQIGVTPKEIRELHKDVDARQRAASEWVNPPKSVNTSITASLSPGSTPPIIRPFYGASTSFMVVDATGAPWPVENARNGNGALFQIDRLDGPQGSVFTVDALQPYGQSNVILKLKGEETPLVINLVAGQKIQDATVQVRVQGLGPNAQAPTGESMTAGTNADLLPVLDGAPPQGGQRLDIQGAAGVSGWLMPDRTMILRSPYRLMSPFIDAIHSPDGTQVYRLPATTKVQAEVAGQDVYLTIAGW